MRCIPAGKRVLRINLDETAICVDQPAPRGHICVSRKKARQLSRHVLKSARRRYITYVCLICDDEAVQAQLPQFLIGNESTLRQRDMIRIQEAFPRNVRLIRRKSAWNDQRVMVRILREVCFIVSLAF